MVVSYSCCTYSACLVKHHQLWWIINFLFCFDILSGNWSLNMNQLRLSRRASVGLAGWTGLQCGGANHHHYRWLKMWTLFLLALETASPWAPYPAHFFPIYYSLPICVVVSLVLTEKKLKKNRTSICYDSFNPSFGSFFLVVTRKVQLPILPFFLFRRDCHDKFGGLCTQQKDVHFVDWLSGESKRPGFRIRVVTTFPFIE